MVIKIREMCLYAFNEIFKYFLQINHVKCIFIWVTEKTSFTIWIPVLLYDIQINQQLTKYGTCWQHSVTGQIIIIRINKVDSTLYPKYCLPVYIPRC